MRLCRLLILVWASFAFIVGLWLLFVAFRNEERSLQSSLIHSNLTQNVVPCIEKLSGTTQRQVKIIFMGDSRILQQFYSFLSVMFKYITFQMYIG